MRQYLLAGVLVALGLVTTGCNALTGNVDVRYSVTGTATRASITYASSSAGTGQTGDVTLPWSFSWTAKKGDFVYVSAQNAGTSGCVRVEITLDGDVLDSQQSCGEFVIASVSGLAE